MGWWNLRGARLARTIISSALLTGFKTGESQPVVQRPRLKVTMKIYFGFTVAGDRSSLDAARRIVELIEALGHEVLTRHLVRDDAWDADRLISPQDVYRRDMRWLQECDLFMAEASGSSFGLGFETGYLLGATPKSAVLFYRRESEKRISLLITGNCHPGCKLVPYSEIEEVEAFIRNLLG